MIPVACPWERKIDKCVDTHGCALFRNAVLAEEALAELARDNQAERAFNGSKRYAATYVYFRAMRAGRIRFEEAKGVNNEAIVAISKHMSTRGGARKAVVTTNCPLWVMMRKPA
jgi:hypothetical protein